MTFTAPTFLIGLVAVAIPIVVHLFNFRRYRKVYFSNVDRLEELQNETRRQSTLRQLLIMAARILAIVFLVLAFARPVVSDSAMSVAGSKSVSLFVDNSFSMENTFGNEILIEKAKAKAREIVSAYDRTDRFQVMTCDAAGSQFHWLSKEEAVEAIDAIEVSGASMTLSSAVVKQMSFLRSNAGDNLFAFVISDFQASATDMANFPADSVVRTVFVPIESSGQNNVYVDSVAIGAPVYQKGAGAAVEVWVRNDGGEDLEKVPVTLSIGGQQRAISTVDLPSGGTEVVTMHFTIDKTGVMDGMVEVSDYPITFDDRYYFSLNVRERIKGVVIGGGERNGYLSRLLEGDSVLDVSFVDAGKMDYGILGESRFVILDELPNYTSGMLQSIENLVKSGGTAVVVPAGDADEESYNRMLSAFSAPQMGGRQQGRVAAVAVDYDNALYANVFGRKVDNMEMPTVSDYYRLTTTSNTLRQPVITLANGDVYLSVTPYGEGRLYLFAAPLRDRNTDFMRQALFVPTLYNMALYSERPTPPALSLSRNEAVRLSRVYDMESGTVRLVPAGDMTRQREVIPDLRSTGNGSSLLLHGEPLEAGNYHLMQGDELMEGLSFNYSRLESQMDFVGREALGKMIEDYGLESVSVVRNTEKSMGDTLRRQMEGHGLWRWCLLACLAMLLLEIALIRQPFSGGKRSKT